MAFLAPNRSDYAEILYGIFGSGNTAVPMTPKHPVETLKYYLQDSQSELLITTEDLASKVNKKVPYVERHIGIKKRL